MPSKLGPHFIGTPGFQRWQAAGPRVFKFDPTSLGAAQQVPPGPLVVGKLDQFEEQLRLTDWKALKNRGLTPLAVARHRFGVQQSIFVGPNKPRVNRYEVNFRVDVWEDDNEVVPDNPEEAKWYAEYCIHMMEQYQAIGKKRANFCFAVGTPHIAPGDPNDVWPHLLPAVEFALAHGHYVALHEYMGSEADLGVGFRQIDGQGNPVTHHWHGRRDAQGKPVESYPYGFVVLRYRWIYDHYFRPRNLHTTPLLITECGCDSVETVTPRGMSVGTWTEHRPHWAATGKDPERHYAGMLKWYDQKLREDSYVKGATIFTVGSVGNWVKWDISGTRVEDDILSHIAAERDKADAPVGEVNLPIIITPGAPGRPMAEAAGFTPGIDLERVAPGRQFTATWTFRNSGDTTWDGGYRFVFSEEAHPETAANPRSPMGAPTAQSITALGAPAQVRPGESVNLTLSLTAPAGVGTHATNWQLQAPDGKRFGPIRWLRAVVVPQPQAESLQVEVLGFENTAGDFNNLRPGRQFSGVWSLKNIGTAAWSGDFRVAYLDASVPNSQGLQRDRMGAKPVFSLKELTGRDRVNPGESVQVPINLTAPLRPGGYAFHWQMQDTQGNPFGGVRWMTIGVVEDGAGRPPVPVPAGRAVAFGMNINPDIHGLDIDRLRGMSWVRLPFFASRLKLSPEDAYRQKYRPIIQAYAAAGIRTLVILLQDTEGGNAPWINGGWEAYADTFGKVCGRVAAVCSEFGDMVAYQIFNEQDSSPENKSAIGMAAENYALILDKAQAAIRVAHPGAKVVFGGLNTGPDNGIRYARAVRDRLGGRLPVDALAIHPYGRFVKLALFNFGSIGRLPDALNQYKAAFPGMPIWITEMGVASDSPIGPEHYANIGTYIREVVDEVSDRFAATTPVLIWFAWTDGMRNSGILTADSKAKPHVFDAFGHMKERGLAALTEAAESQEAAGTAAEFVSYSTTLSDLNAVPAGTTFTSRFRFRNVGATTWGDGFRLVYVERGSNPTPMMARTSFALSEVASPGTVPPGGQTEIALTMTAPERTGRAYRSHWELRDPSGFVFGFLFEEITVIPAPTAGSGARKADMVFVDDRTVRDGTAFVAGQDFHKQWVVRNTGSRHWGSGFRLVFVDGDLQMARGVPAHIVPEARPGEEVILDVPMTAPPARNGLVTPYRSLWRLQDDRGDFFGHSLTAVIVSKPAAPISGGVPVVGVNALAALANDPAIWYTQLDPAWAEVILGFGDKPFRRWGCLVTCMTMALNAHGLRINPLEVNNRLVALGDGVGYFGSNVFFIAPTRLLMGLRQGHNAKSVETADIPNAVWIGGDPIRRIDEALAAGQIVLAQVDTKPNNGLFDAGAEQHWVILLKRTPEGDDYLVLDPLVRPEQLRDQPRSLMVKYGNRAPSLSNEANLRNAILSAMTYHF